MAEVKNSEKIGKDGAEKNKGFSDLFKIIFYDFLMCKKVNSDFLIYSNLLNEADKVCNVYKHTHKIGTGMFNKGKLIQSKESGLYKSSQDIKSLISIINNIIIVFLISYFVLLFKYGGIEYIKYCFENISKFVKISDDISKIANPRIFKLIFGFNTKEFLTFLIPFLSISTIHFFFAVFVKSLYKNSEMITQTILFRKLATSEGFVTEERVSSCLWTPIGLFIDIEKGDAKSFAEAKNLWTQLSLSPGKVDVSSTSDHLIFANTGFKLPTRVEYTFSGKEKITKISYQ